MVPYNEADSVEIMGLESSGNGVAELQQYYHEHPACTSLGEVFLSLRNPNRVGLTQSYCNKLAVFRGPVGKANSESHALY
jgi:hypothetical protein